MTTTRLEEARSEPGDTSTQTTRSAARGRRGGKDRAPGPWTRWQQRHRVLGGAIEMVTVVAAALVLSFLVKTFLAQPFYIPSDSMNDTLLTGDRVAVSKLSRSLSEIRRGDVVVFKDPGCTTASKDDENCWLDPEPEVERTALQRWSNSALTAVGILPPSSDQFLIKRVIGVGGDRVRCCSDSGQVEVNGVAITEPYLRPGSIPSELEFDVQVPEGHVWVMGDNRQNSEDSRYHQDGPDQGFVPLDDVVGTAFVKLWPASRWGWMTNPEDTFADVPDTAPSSAAASGTQALDATSQD